MENSNRIVECRGGRKVISRREVYSNEFGRKFFHDETINPDGKRGIYGWTVIKPGAYALPLDDDGNVHLELIDQYATSIRSLEVPSGGVENRDSFLETAKRELKEELGITAEEWIDINPYDPMPGAIFSPQHSYLARKLSFGQHNRESVELDMEHVVMPLEQALKAAYRGRIRDAGSIITIFRADYYLRFYNRK